MLIRGLPSASNQCRSGPRFTASGASDAMSRSNACTSRAWSIGQTIFPPRITGSIRCSRYSIEVTTPKLPPPPRRPQQQVGVFVDSLAWRKCRRRLRHRPTTLSQASPKRRPEPSQPPPSVRPAAPVCETVPAWSQARRPRFHDRADPSTGPGLQVGALGFGVDTHALHLARRSIMSPPSQVDFPERLWPPARTAVSNWCSRAKFDGLR